MRILIANDDGYQAPGITALQHHLRGAGHQVYMVAPCRNRSACSSSLTVRSPLLPVQFDETSWYVQDGTPADCVHLALLGLLGFTPDALISGINDMANLGDDTLYSGTVAAALEARHIDGPKLAVSLVEGDNFDAAAAHTVDFLHRLTEHPNTHDNILNINIPHTANIKGWKATRLGKRLQSHPMRCDTDSTGRTIFHIGAVGDSHHHQDGTDFEAVAQGYISVTPLTPDLTDHSRINTLDAWLST